jgi:hypothetical protein
LDIFLHLLAVSGLGAVTLWSAVPVGIALGLDPWTTGFAAAAGAGLGTALVLGLSERIRSEPPAVLAKTATHRRGLMYRTWENCGTPGLGLLAPLAIGAPLGAALGILLGAPVGRLAFWLVLGIVLWSIVLTFAAALALAPLFPA